MLYQNQYNEQQDFVDDEEPTLYAAKGPHGCLHRTNPNEVVELVSTDRAERHAKPTKGCLHKAKPTTSSISQPSSN